MHELEWPPLCAACSAPLTYCTTINDNAHVDPTGPACLAIDTATVDLAMRIQREITRDTAAGLIPIWVSSMWQLHDYVDATAYGGLADDSARVLTTVVRVHAEVDRWLAARGHVPTFRSGHPITRSPACTPRPCPTRSASSSGTRTCASCSMSAAAPSPWSQPTCPVPACGGHESAAARTPAIWPASALSVTSPASPAGSTTAAPTSTVRSR